MFSTYVTGLFYLEETEQPYYQQLNHPLTCDSTYYKVTARYWQFIHCLGKYLQFIGIQSVEAIKNSVETFLIVQQFYIITQDLLSKGILYEMYVLYPLNRF